MQCVVDGNPASDIKVFENGTLTVCPTHATELKNAKKDRYAPRKYRKYMKHHLKPST